MRNYEAPRCRFNITDGRVFTEAEKVYNITGTSVGALLGCSPYATPFTTSARMLGLWDEDISDKPAIVAGKLLEERVIEYVAAKHRDVGQFLTAAELFDAREGRHENWKSDFQDDVFAGHIDGIVSKDGQDFILEVKTVNMDPRNVNRDLSAWESGGIPEHYLWQVYLYNHFITKQDKAYFAVGMLTNDTYSDPLGWVPNRENCILVEVPIDRKMVAEKLDGIREVYKELVESRATLPADMNNPMDRELMTHLMDISGDTDRLLEVSSRYESLMEEIDAEDAKMKEKRAQAEEYKERIKAMMTAHSLTRCNNLSLSTQKRETFDFVKARADGLDITPYTIVKTVTTLRRSRK